jgi:hypothetical protein
MLELMTYEYMWSFTKLLVNLVYIFGCLIILLYFFGMFYDDYRHWVKKRKFNKYLQERELKEDKK